MTVHFIVHDVELQMLMTQTTNLNSPLGASGVHSPSHAREPAGSDILDSDVAKIQLDKSNILLLGPTGSGNLCATWRKIINIVEGVGERLPWEDGGGGYVGGWC